MTANPMTIRRILRRRRLLPVLAALLLTVPAACNKPKEAGAGSDADKPGKTDAAKGPTEVALTPEAIEKYGIAVDEAKLQVLTPTFVAPGEVAFNAERMSYVGTPIAGRVAELKARVGEDVKKGDVLIVLHSDDFAVVQSDYLQKQTAAAVAVPTVELTRSAYDRAKRLYDEDRGQTLSLTEVQKREAEYRAAEGNLRLAQCSVTAACNRLQVLGMEDDAVKKLEGGGPIGSDFAIRAPIDGQVIERLVTLGELVRPEKQSLITVADLSTVWVLADVPDFRLKNLVVGAAARIETGEGPTPLEGKVSYLPPQLDPTTRTAQVRIEVRNASGSLRAGEFTQVEIATGKQGPDMKPVLAIPDEAVQTIDGKPSVFVPVAGKDNTFVPKAVVVSPGAAGLVTVEAGLKPGQRFVRSGTFILKAELLKSSVED